MIQMVLLTLIAALIVFETYDPQKILVARRRAADEHPAILDFLDEWRRTFAATRAVIVLRR